MGLGDWIGDLLGSKNTYNAVAPVNSYQASDNGAAGQVGTAYQNAASNYGQQQNYIDMLQQQANGTGGPSVAAQLMAQQTQQNNMSAASLVGSQRGLNPAMAARMGLVAQASNNQASAQSGALLRAQEMTTARGQLGQALGQQGAQNLGVLGQANAASQHAQGLNAGVAAQNANLQMGAEQINAGVAGQNAASSGALMGGLLSGAGAFGPMASSPIKGGSGAGAGGGYGAGEEAAATYGGSESATFGLGQGADAAALAFDAGGRVPGQARAAGDAPQNDTVPAELSPGEIVLPRSVTQGADAPERARAFVEALQRRKGKAKTHFDEGGEVGDPDSLPDVVTRTADKDKLDLLRWLKPAGDGKKSGSAPPLTGGLEDLEVGLPEGQGGPAPDASPAAAPGVPDMLAAPPVEPAASPGTSARANAPAQGAPPMLAAPRDPALGQIAAGGRQEAKALGDVGAAKAAGLSDVADVQSKGADESQAQSQQMMQQVQARIAEQDARAKQIAGVDPNRYWNNLSTSGKVTNLIALLLGGIGSGLTGKPNAALEQINKLMDNDINAQKINIGKKENELSRYMEGTRDLQTAQHLLAAQHLSVVAEQVAAAQAKMGSAASMPEAQMMIGQLKQRQAVETQQAQERGNTIQMQKLQMTMAQRQMQFLQQARQSKDPNALAIAGKEIEYLQHPEKRGAEQVDVPEVQNVGKDAQGNMRTQIVSRPYYGKSDAHAVEASKAMIRQRNIETSLSKLEQFAKANPLGGVPGRLTQGEATAAAATLKTNLEGALSDMNRPASPETMKQMDEIVGDPTAFFKSPMAYEGSLKFVRKLANDHKQAVIDAHTLGPMHGQ